MSLVVVKVGSSTLVSRDGSLDRKIIESLCKQVSTLVAEGHSCIVVSSGAAAAGMGRLGFKKRPTDVPTLQACCSAGQAALTETYAEILGESGIPCGQVLLARGDVVSREGYLNSRGTLLRLLELGAVPVVNENDAVSSSEITFGDNDTLGAIVSTLVGADLYIVLSDVDGLMDSNPSVNPDAKLVRRVSHVTPEIMASAGDSSSGVGTGGMITKLRAARAMLAACIPMVICNGRQEDVIVDVVHGEEVGTRFEAPAGTSHEAARKFWIGLAGISRGSLTIDDGARDALVNQGGSLLPVGVTAVDGTFSPGDVVGVVDRYGTLVGRGIARYSSDDLNKARGLRLEVIERFLPELAGQPCIHRDELLLF